MRLRTGYYPGCIIELSECYSSRMLLPLHAGNLAQYPIDWTSTRVQVRDETLKKFLQKMAAVAFCPPAFVRTAWLGVQQQAPQIPQVDRLVDYFDRTWVNGHFHFHQWNYFDFAGRRTNNHVEGWHSRVKKVVGKPHPNIYELIDVIKKEDATTRMKLQLCESGARMQPRRMRIREREIRIQTLFSRFRSGALSINDFLEAIKYQTGL